MSFRIWCVTRIKIGTKRSNFHTGFWKGSSGCVSNWFWKKPDSSGVNSYERNYGRETFERSCRLSAATYCLWANGISILDRINGSYAHGLSFGGYIVRQISTRIYISGERFGEAIFFVDEEKENNTPFFSSLSIFPKWWQTFRFLKTEDLSWLQYYQKYDKRFKIWNSVW